MGRCVPKVKTEVSLKLGALAAACSKAEEIEEENKAVLEKARRVEEEVKHNIHL